MKSPAVFAVGICIVILTQTGSAQGTGTLVITGTPGGGNATVRLYCTSSECFGQSLP